MATAWGYLPNSGDRRLASINNTGLAAGQFSNYSFTSMPETLISGVTEASDAATVYPDTATQTASYNNVNQLTDLSGQALTDDPDGNLLSDGTRNYFWDAENRLVTITYPGTPGKQTAFTYDGLGRRTAIGSTPGGGGGGTVTTAYLWCGSRICQARDAGNAVTREYYAEGEYVPGSPAQPYYYGIDQIGTVRRAFASPTSAPAYAYDPYGNPLQATAPLTDFTYAGMFYNADSGLDLTQYRAYDPVAGRWLSRELLGEGVLRLSATFSNLYAYGIGNPIANVDPNGLLTFTFGGGVTAAFILGGTVGGGFSVSFWDQPFQVSAYGTIGGGLGLGASADVSAGLYNGPISGPSYTASASALFGGGASANQSGGSGSFGVGAGVFVGKTITGTLPLYGAPDPLIGVPPVFGSPSPQPKNPVPEPSSPAPGPTSSLGGDCPPVMY